MDETVSPPRDTAWPRAALRQTDWRIAGTYIVAYVALDWVSYIHPIAPYAISPWNPAAGLSLFLLLALGPGYAPAVLVATVLAEIIVHSGSTHPGHAVLFSTILAAGYVGMAWWLLARLRFDARFTRLRDLVAFTATIGPGTMLIAANYVSAHIAAGQPQWNVFGEYTLRLWVGEAIGIVITTPFLLLHGTRLARMRPPMRLPGTEPMLQALSIVAALAILFTLDAQAAAKFFYVLFLPLVWISMRRGFEGATAALLATQLGLIVSMQLADYAASSVIELQLLMLALAVTGLFLGMAATESRNARAALQQREAELNTIVETAPDAILTADAGGAIMAANPRAADLFGKPASQLVGHPVSVLIPGLDVTRAILAEEARALHTDGSAIAVEVSFAPASVPGHTAYIGVVRDIAPRKEMEARLRERDAELERTLRAAAAAEMASALAHELNQPLTAASNYVEVCSLALARDEAGSERMRQAVGQASTELGRAADVVRRLREFYRGGEPRREPVPVTDLIDRALHPSRGRIDRHRVEIRVGVFPELPVPAVDRVQIEMVLHNLIANAIDAVSLAQGGERTIAIDAAPADEGFIVIGVRDTWP